MRALIYLTDHARYTAEDEAGGAAISVIGDNAVMCPSFSKLNTKGASKWSIA
jgi:hypothetical protein